MNFALLLFVLLVVTGIVWLLEKLVLKPRRRQRAVERLASWEAEQKSRGIDGGEPAREAVRAKALQEPWWIEYTAGLFPVILVVFLLRSFVAEPFKIPSGSMLPTLQVGDLILVNKFTYGLRLPVIHTKVLDVGQPQRGDVMVFRFPKDPSLDYIKRVVGIPGDRITYENKRLSVNGKPVSLTADGQFYDKERLAYENRYLERLGEVDHKILTDLEKPSFITPDLPFPHQDQCDYGSGGVSCVVPPGSYFMMGDNRDNSFDGRFWGFVPEKNIVGRAFFIWMNLGDLSRIGGFH